MVFKISLSLFLLGIFTQTNAQDKGDLLKFPLHTMNKNSSLQLLFYVSGDGGWNSFSQKLCEELSQKGYAVVCLDAKKYFWEQKTPEKFAQDASEILGYYLKLWNKDAFSIVGYSFGADAVAFLPNRISKYLQNKLKSNVLLIPSPTTNLEVKVSDMFGFGTDDGKYKILAEINKIQPPVLCIFAKDDENSLATQIKGDAGLKKIFLPGSHKFDNEVKKVVQTVSMGL
ncbi:hypothetical protein EZJ43_11320 [Pedobacter changchengzhani]|uniref:Bacterial virulence domain-containing protein n=1 Tax=Pedobacter changchengzhani TaxID=2529274 RepID=A0A4R5ML47_9SPHI|nr:AcvB/VirJ family lysyl-phosphatidylglycerol hydrolase [Pedobacter changchengzhani]TDG35935.1 hypothetical protein EZJ43_11320 [Pedobacter changchengzhani]